MPTLNSSRFRRLATGLCCGALYAPLVVYAQGSINLPADLRPAPTLWRVTTETLNLPGGEKMGVVGAGLLFDVGDQVRLGIASYDAVRGERGGFITLGLAAEFRQRLSSSWFSHAGFFVGAGGGRGGYTLSGGGLMLRGDLGLSYESARYGNFGFGLSRVQFPTGVIGSTQPFVQYDFPFFSLLSSGWAAGMPGEVTRSAEATELSTRAQEFSLVTRSYKIPSSVVRDDGTPQHSSMQLLGVEWLSWLDDQWFLKLESEGAMGGQSNGYMQILAGGGYRMPLTRSTAIKFHAAAGPAGGGGVDTGGGLLLDAGVSLKQKLTRRTALELSVGELRAPSRSFNARSLAVKLNYEFGLPGVSEKFVSTAALGGYEASKLRARVTSQTYFKASPLWRNRSVDQSISNLGLQIDYFASPNWYVTGQGLAAYAGDAGAYMIGEVGLGRVWSLSQSWFVQGEALLGAAGGGGLAVGGGLVGQANAALGYRLSKSLSLIGIAGRVKAFAGDFNANVAGLSLAYQFTAFTGK